MSVSLSWVSGERSGAPCCSGTGPLLPPQRLLCLPTSGGSCPPRQRRQKETPEESFRERRTPLALSPCTCPRRAAAGRCGKSSFDADVPPGTKEVHRVKSKQTTRKTMLNRFRSLNPLLFCNGIKEGD